MAVALQTKPLTYEEYLAEGEVEGRYEIIDGVRHYMTGATRRHNRVIFKLARALTEFEEASKVGRCYLSPSDLLLSRKPLRTRQPDVYFMSNARIAMNPPEESAEPLAVGPELVIEVLSPSDTRRALAGKLEDYAKLYIEECWLVSPEGVTVQVLQLMNGKYDTVEIYGFGEIVSSIVFEKLTVKVDDIFAE